MPLIKQFVDIPTTGGVDTKTDSVNDTPPALSDINNLRFTNTGAYDPRPSFDDIQVLAATSTGFLAEARDSALSLVDGYLYKTVNGAHTNLAPTWAPTGRSFAMGGGYTSVGSGTGSLKPTSATLTDGTIIHVWENSTVGFGYQFMTDDGEFLVAGQQTYANPRFLIVTPGPSGSAIVWLTSGASALAAYQITSSGVTALTVPSLTVSKLSAVYSSTDAAWYLVYQVGSVVTLAKLTLSGSTMTSASTVTVISSGMTDLDVIRSTNYIVVAHWIKDGDLNVKFYDTSLVIQATQTRTPATTTPLYHLGFGICETTTDTIVCSFTVYYPASGPVLQAFRFTTAAAANIWDARGVGFVSPTPPIYLNSRVYIYAVDDNVQGAQSSALVQIANYDGGTVSQIEIVSQWGADSTSLSAGNTLYVNGDYTSKSRMSKTANTLTVPYLKSGPFQYTSDAELGNTSAFGSSLILSDFAVAPAIAASMQFSLVQSPHTRAYTMGSSSVLVSSCAKDIDGAGQGPSSPWCTPFPYQKQLIDTGNLPLGVVYTYVFVKVWTDSLGNRQSLESFPVRVTTFDGTPDYNQFRFYFPPSAFEVYATPTSGQTTAAIEVYRTEQNGTIPYQLTVLTSSTSMPYTDNALDDSLRFQVPLPSSSGELTNTIVPGARASVAWKGRLALLPFDTDSTILYSKPIENFTFPAFAAGLEISVPQTTSPLTALGTMDGVLYAFTNNQVFTIYGDPAGNTGENSTLTLPEIRFNGVGCQDPASVVLAPPGLFFKSAKGIYLILRNQELSFVGTGPFDERDETVVGTWADEDTSEVAFALDSGEVWVYDWQAKEWSRWTPPVGTGDSITGATLVNNRPTYITQDAIYQTVDTDVETIPTSVTTAWIRLGALQGYQRVYAMWLYLERLADHTLTIDMYIDGSETSVNTWTIVSTGLATTTPEQIRLSVPIQKCSSIKLKIASTNAGWKLKGIMAEIGTKDSSFKSRNAPNNY